MGYLSSLCPSFPEEENSWLWPSSVDFLWFLCCPLLMSYGMSWELYWQDSIRLLPSKDESVQGSRTCDRPDIWVDVRLHLSLRQELPRLWVDLPYFAQTFGKLTFPQQLENYADFNRGKESIFMSLILPFFKRHVYSASGEIGQGHIGQGRKESRRFEAVGELEWLCRLPGRLPPLTARFDRGQNCCRISSRKTQR